MFLHPLWKALRKRRFCVFGFTLHVFFFFFFYAHVCLIPSPLRWDLPCFIIQIEKVKLTNINTFRGNRKITLEPNQSRRGLIA